MKIFSFVFQQGVLDHYYYKGEALIRPNYPFFIPDTSEPYVARPALALRIGRTGKEVAARFAHRYIQAIGVGFDLIAPQLLEQKKANSAPWEEAVAFEYASAADGFTPYTELAESYTLAYWQTDDTTPLCTQPITEMQIRTAIERMSRLNIIHVGDILLLHHQEDLSLPLLLEKSVHIASNEYIESQCTLRIK